MKPGLAPVLLTLALASVVTWATPESKEERAEEAGKVSGSFDPWLQV